jgi:hypothetical protein
VTTGEGVAADSVSSAVLDLESLRVGSGDAESDIVGVATSE